MFHRLAILSSIFAFALASLATAADELKLQASLSADERPDAPSAEDGKSIGAAAIDPVEFVHRFCLDCHAGLSAEAGLNLETFAGVDDVASATDQWNKISQRVYAGQMPPEESARPSIELRREFVRWVETTIHSAICDDGVLAGPPQLRRLNRTEYGNTIRDLLRIHINAAEGLPSDGAGGEGFDNAAETLFISPIHAEKYLDAARMALNHALKDPRAKGRIIHSRPSKNTAPTEAARDVLSDFLRRAFRRPVGQEEISEYLHLFATAFAETESYETSIQFALQAALTSPKFLFLWETPPESDGMTPVSQYEMASRLSYFLWASMPDKKLFDLAEQGQLHDPAILEEQVARMLHSPTNRKGLRSGAKVRGFATSFIEQWLGTRQLGREFKPDPKIAKRYDSELEGGMKFEPVFVFEDILSDNRSLLHLIDSDFTYVNRRLARHYKIDGRFREQPKKVELPEDSHRGGVLSMAAVLAVSSYPHRTSPVLRGKWVLEKILGTPPPPPPPDVGELEETVKTDKPVSLRERLQQHRTQATCASCHASIDPLGFGLENYDVLGRWRTEADGIPIDARGTLPDGSEYDGPRELKQLLLGRKDQFIRHLTSKLLGYALGRGLTDEDRCAIDEIVAAVKQDDYHSHTLIAEIVKSVPFRYKQNLAKKDDDSQTESGGAKDDETNAEGREPDPS